MHLLIRHPLASAVDFLTDRLVIYFNMLSSYKNHIFFCLRFQKLKESGLELAKNLKKNGIFEIALEPLTINIFK